MNGPERGSFQPDTTVTDHDDALLSALETARVAAVNIARLRGHISPPVCAAAEAILAEIDSLVTTMRTMSVLGFDALYESERAAPPETADVIRRPMPVGVRAQRA